MMMLLLPLDDDGIMMQIEIDCMKWSAERENEAHTHTHKNEQREIFKHF